MDSTTQLALMAKAKRVFESDGHFLSFPALSPLAYPPEKLCFSGAAADLATLAEFSLLVNHVPRGAVFQPSEDDHLWDVYAGLFRDVQLGSKPVTAEETAAYERAAATLYIKTSEGRQDTPAYRAYKQYHDAWIASQEEYKAAQVTAECSEDPSAKERWQQTEEPPLRAKVAQAEADWAARGSRAEVEEAEAVERAYTGRASSARLWEEWRSAFNPDIDQLTDTSGQAYAPTAFSPVDPFDSEWPTFTLSSDEIARLIAEAPSELKEVLDLTDTGPAVQRVSFQFRSVVLNRPWLRPEVFRARFWRLPASATPLSDGGSPPKGTCPAYVAALVLARNIVETVRGPSGDTSGPMMMRSLPRMMMRDARAVRPFEPRAREGLLAATAIQLASVAPVVEVPPTTPSPAAAPLMRHFAVPAQRLKLSAFRMALGVQAAVAEPSLPPAPAAPSPTPPSHDITILAFICKPLPRCPDPDPALTWPG